EARYKMGPADLKAIRERCRKFLESVAKTISILPFLANSEKEYEAAVENWFASAGDVGDSTLVAETKAVVAPNILSDDFDLVTFNAITVSTANAGAVDAAKDANKPLN